MSRENVELVQRLFDTYLEGDYASALECLAPNVVCETGQEVPAHAREAVLAMWQRWESDWDELRTVPGSTSTPAAGVEFNDVLFDVYTARDSECVRKREFRTRSAARAAASRSG